MRLQLVWAFVLVVCAINVSALNFESCSIYSTNNCDGRSASTGVPHFWDTTATCYSWPCVNDDQNCCQQKAQCSASVACNGANKHVDTTLWCNSATCGQECCVDNLCSFTAWAYNYDALTGCDTTSGKIAGSACALTCNAEYEGTVTASCPIHDQSFVVINNCKGDHDIIVIANPTYEGRYKHILNDPSLGEYFMNEANSKTLHRTQNVTGDLDGWMIGSGASALCVKSAVETPVNLLGHWANCLTGRAVQLSLYVYQPHAWAHRRPDGEGPFETCASFNCGTQPRRPGPTPVCPHEGCTVEHCCVATCATFNCDVLGLKRRPNAASVTCPLHDSTGAVGCNEGRCCAQTCESARIAGDFVPSDCVMGARANLPDILCHRSGCTNGRCCVALKCPSATDPNDAAWTEWCNPTNQVANTNLAGTYTADQTQKNPADCCMNKMCVAVSGKTCTDDKVWTTDPNTQCGTAPCGNNDNSCCVNRLCSDATIADKTCDDDQEWTSSSSLRCEDASCPHADGNCCVNKKCLDGTIAVKTCNTNQEWTSNPLTICAGAVCGHNDGNCCVNKMCTAVSGTCSGKNHWTNDPSAQCAGALCGADDGNCCVPNPYCPSTGCTAGVTHPNPAHQCNGATCGSSDPCCVANPTCGASGFTSDSACNPINGPFTKHLKANIGGHTCNGATCIVDDCCEDNDICSDTNSLFNSDLLCRQAVLGTHLKATTTPCSTIHCSVHGECCEANPTCHGTTQAFCGDGYHLNNNLDHVVCLTGTCDKADCCVANPTCNQARFNTLAQCAPFSKVLATNLDTSCRTTTCDDTDCCVAV